MLNILILLVIISIVAFVAAQNASPVVLTFLFWKFEASLSVIIFLSVFAGVLMAAIFIFSSYIRRFMKDRRKSGETTFQKKE